MTGFETPTADPRVEAEVLAFVRETVLPEWEKTRERREKLNQIQGLYFGEPGITVDAGRANTSVSELFRDVETLVSRGDQAIYSEDPWYSLLPTETTDTELADLNQAYTEAQFERIKLKTKTVDALRRGLRDGTVIVKTPYRYEETWRSAPAIPRAGKKAPKPRLVPTFDDPDFQVIPLTRVVVDPRARGGDLSTARWVGEYRAELTRADLLAEQRQGRLVGVKRLWEAGPPPDAPDQDSRDQSAAMAGRSATASETQQQEFSLIEVWLFGPRRWLEPKLWDTDEGEEVRPMVLVTNDTPQWVLRLDPHPNTHGELPYLACCFVETDEFYGRGVGDINYRQQLELNATRDYLLDYAQFGLENMWLKDKHAELPEDLKIKRNKVIPTINMNGLKQLVPDPTPMTIGLRLEGTIKEDMRNNAGATTTLQGQLGGTGATATEIQTLRNEALARLAGYLRQFSERILRAYVRRVLEMNEQYVTTKKMVRQVGPEGERWVTMRANQHRADLDVRIKVATDLENRTTRIQQQLSFLEVVGKLPPAQQPKNLAPAIRRLGKNFGMHRDELDELFGVRGAVPLTLEQENAALAAGQRVLPLLGEDTMAHTQGHVAYAQAHESTFSPEARAAFVEHLAATERLAADSPPAAAEASGGAQGGSAPVTLAAPAGDQGAPTPPGPIPQPGAPAGPRSPDLRMA